MTCAFRPWSRRARACGIGKPIVDAMKQDILIGHLPAGGAKIRIGRLEHRIQADLLIDGHQLVAQLLGRRMEGDGQVVLPVEGGKLPDLLGQADR